MNGSTNSIWKVNGKYEQIVNYTMLYDEGDECEGVTGGWADTTYATNAVVKKYSNYIHLHSYRAAAYTNNKVNLSNYDKVFANTYTLGRSGTTYDSQAFRMAELKTSTTGTLNGIVATHGFNVNYPTAQKYIFDFEIKDEAKGEYYFCVQTDDSSANAYINLYNLALIKKDDWETLGDMVDITATSIDDILTNSITLLSNKNAVEFMIYNCTGNFMTSAVQSSTFLTALNNSQYKTIIMANEHWAKFLSMVA